MKFVVCIFNGINLVVSCCSKTSQLSGFVRLFLPFSSFDIFRLMHRRHHRLSWWSLLVLLVSPTPHANQRVFVLFTHEKIYSIFMWYSDREFLQINNIKIKFIFGNLEYTIVNLYGACSRIGAAAATKRERERKSKMVNIRKMSQLNSFRPANKQINKKIRMRLYDV